MEADKAKHRSEAATVVAAIRERARGQQFVGITLEESDELLAQARCYMREIDANWQWQPTLDPKCGTTAHEAVEGLIKTFDMLDKGLSAKSPLPSDWSDGES